jgi:hypothetical protein
MLISSACIVLASTLAGITAAIPHVDSIPLRKALKPRIKHVRGEKEQDYSTAGQICYQSMLLSPTVVYFSTSIHLLVLLRHLPSINFTHASTDGDCTPGGCCVWPNLDSPSSSTPPTLMTTKSVKPSKSSRRKSKTKPRGKSAAHDATELETRVSQELHVEARSSSGHSTTTEASLEDRSAPHDVPRGTCAPLASEAAPCSERKDKNQALGPGQGGYIDACPCDGPYLICVPLVYEPTLGDYHCEVHG